MDYVASVLDYVDVYGFVFIKDSFFEIDIKIWKYSLKDSLTT